MDETCKYRAVNPHLDEYHRKVDPVWVNLMLCIRVNYTYSILIRSNKMQQYAVIFYCKITLHVSGVHRTHHQEYIKL
jgi:hypothetical protein